MERKLFCEINPLCYKIAVTKCSIVRHIKNVLSKEKLAKEKKSAPLPVCAYEHRSMIRRRLGGVDMRLQENKATNLALAAPNVNGILIKPGETFSFWKLVGKTSAGNGYKEGLTISCGSVGQGVGGGLCQFTNLLHWMVLHSPLTVTERHHHNQYDLFPDFERKVPFGTGTSIMYNYLDYRFRNDTDQTFQILVWVEEDVLRGELRCEVPMAQYWEVTCEEEAFEKEADAVYRNGKVYRSVFDNATGALLKKELLQENHAKVLYDYKI